MPPKLVFNRENLEQLPITDVICVAAGSGTTDDSEELTLLFPDGTELTIYYNSTDNSIVVEAD